MKRSIGGDQTFDLNRIDFERAGSGRKAGYKFNIEFVQGRVANVISGSPLASDLAAVLVQDAGARAIFAQNDFTINLNTKFQLAIHHVPGAAAPDEQTDEPTDENPDERPDEHEPAEMAKNDNVN